MKGYRVHSGYKMILQQQLTILRGKERLLDRGLHKQHIRSSDHHRSRRSVLPVEARHAQIREPCNTAPPLCFHWKENLGKDNDRNAKSNLISIDNRIIQSKENNRSLEHRGDCNETKPFEWKLWGLPGSLMKDERHRPPWFSTRRAEPAPILLNPWRVESVPFSWVVEMRLVM